MIGAGVTDPHVVLTDSGSDQEATSNIDTSELTDPTCELVPTDAGAIENVLDIGLGIKEIEEHLLKGRFAEVEGVSLAQMEELSRFDARLLLHGELLGAALLQLLVSYQARDGSISDQWESALWVTGMHWDVAVRDNLGDFDTAENEEDRKISLRCLAWSVLDDIEELNEAAGDTEDACGLMLVYQEVVDTLAQRWDFLNESGLSDSEALGDDLPIEPTGILSVNGFEWSLRETNQ